MPISGSGCGHMLNMHSMVSTPKDLVGTLVLSLLCVVAIACFLFEVLGSQMGLENSVNL